MNGVEKIGQNELAKMMSMLKRLMEKGLEQEIADLARNSLIAEYELSPPLLWESEKTSVFRRSTIAKSMNYIFVILGIDIEHSLW